jgi:hypothetical protein
MYKNLRFRALITATGATATDQIPNLPLFHLQPILLDLKHVDHGKDVWLRGSFVFGFTLRGNVDSAT